MMRPVQHVRLLLRPTLGSSAYVGIVLVVAAAGFLGESTRLILGAALLALPMSAVAVPAYYAMYGLLALVPGANPGTSTGSCTPDETCQGFATGGLAPWFEVTTTVLGILAITGAAVVDVVVVRLFRASRTRPGMARSD